MSHQSTMQTMFMSKPATQDLLRQLRHAGHEIKRIDTTGYEIDHPATGARIFSAMIGHRGYLIRYSTELMG